MINKKSNYLVILIATYNRLNLLRKALNSIIKGTHCNHEIIVIDGGSTDGTIEYLKLYSSITSVFQGRLLGVACCYNDVWRRIESKYTCWLSDDTEIVEGSLDIAVEILESNPRIGMVALKTKDTVGPWTTEPYMGMISMYGIINCNHGVLPTELLRNVGYFNEGYYTYMIDPDLTASVLCAGKSVVMTKRICVLHHREWILNEDIQKKIERDKKGIDNLRIYREKFKFLGNLKTNYESISRKSLLHRLAKNIYKNLGSVMEKIRLNEKDLRNLIKGRFVCFIDPILNIGKPYYMVQKIPRNLLEVKMNPYRYLLK